MAINEWCRPVAPPVGVVASSLVVSSPELFVTFIQIEFKKLPDLDETSPAASSPFFVVASAGASASGVAVVEGAAGGAVVGVGVVVVVVTVTSTASSWAPSVWA